MPTWRTIIELSTMNNNDEYVVHGDHEIDWDEAKEVVRGAWITPRLRISRPVHPAELAAGLDTSYIGPKIVWEDESRDEKSPQVTKCLDALYMFYNQFLFHLSTFKDPDPGKVLAHIIAYDYYDCMSGGASRYTLAMARELIERHNVDLTIPVYPGKKGGGWHTLADFLEEIKHIPRIHQMLPEGVSISGLLPDKK